MEDLLDVIEMAVEDNNKFPGENQAEYIYRNIKPYIVSRSEFNELAAEIEKLDDDRGCFIDDSVNEDDVAEIAKEVLEEEFHPEEIKKMYSEIKKMHQELIDKQGVL